MKPLKQQPDIDLPEPDERLAAVRTFARRHEYEAGHCEQVTHLAECLFDGLKAHFQLSEQDRFLLTCGAILHDIGWVDGQQKHHKTSMQMILSDTIMPLDAAERIQIALIARYHRKSLPKSGHPLYSELTEKERAAVELLAGIVRLTDGLDRTHTKAIQGLTVDLRPRCILVVCKTAGPFELEISCGSEKADLLQRATGCMIEITVAP